MTDGPSSDDAVDLVRILGRTIMVVSTLIAVFIFVLSGSEAGPEGRIWYGGAVGAAGAFLISGLLAWGLLRGVAQIRDRVEDLIEEDRRP